MVERLQQELHEEKERYHDSCCTWQHSAEEHANDLTLMKNMLNLLVPAFNRCAIGVIINDNNSATFIKENVEVNLHYADLLRVGTESIFGMFGALPFE